MLSRLWSKRSVTRRVLRRTTSSSPYIPDYFCQQPHELARIARARTQSAYMGDHTMICRVLGKYIMWLDSQDVGIVPHLCLDGFWEPSVTVAVARILKPGWLCVDVGANHGYYTLVLADAVGPHGRVTSAEPNPRLCELLTRTVSSNGFGQVVTILDRALADSDDQAATLVVPADYHMNASLYRSALPGDHAFGVRTITLDRLTGGWPRVDFVKIDAEGAEEAIWRGAQHTLESNPDIFILMEINCGRYRDPSAFLREIEGMRFPLRYVEYDGSIQPITPTRILSERIHEDWMLLLHR